MAVKASVTITISKYRDTDSITRYYKLQASTAAAPAVPTTLTPSGWSTSEPTYTSGSTNTLYYTDCVIFSDGTFQYTDDGNGKAVKSSSYEAAKEAYNKAQAAQNTANQTQENLDNLEIGGRNYILRSSEEYTLSIPQGTNKYTFRALNISDALIELDETIKTFTISFDAYSQNGGTHLQGYLRGTTASPMDSAPDSGISTTEWKRYSITKTIKNGYTVKNIVNFYLRIEGDSTDTVCFKNIKVEVGNKPTDWTPAPEDMASQDNLNDSYNATMSRGEQLITNGSAILKNNYNFSTFEYDGTQSFNSAGSFKRKNKNPQPAHTDEIFPVNPDKTYFVSEYLKSENGTMRFYDLLLFYDVDKKLIRSPNHMFRTGSTTELAEDLNNGDTVVHLVDASGFDETLTQDYRRGFIFWNYKNSAGYQYPPETYSQNYYIDLFEQTGINKTNNTITLKTAWDKGTIPAGTKLSQCDSGADLKYLNAYALIPTEWTRFTGVISGIDYTGTNVAKKFPPGTAFASMGWLWNYNNVDEYAWVTNVSVTEHITGKDSVINVDVEYYLSTSSTSLSGGSWSTTAPQWVDGKYMWSRQKITYGDNRIEYKNQTCIAGAKGSTGATGTSVDSITEEYYLSTSKTTQTGGSWSTTPPTWESGKYIWTRSKIVYKNPGSTAYTTPLCSSEWEAVNDINIGGRNLAKNPLKFDRKSNNITFSDNLITFSEINQDTFFNIVLHTSLEAEQEYTLSWECEGLPDDYQGLAFPLFAQSNPINKTLLLKNGKQKVIFSLPSDSRYVGTDYIFMDDYGTRPSATNITIKNIKLEKGNKPTDWTPAPEDTDEAIETVSAYAQNVANELLTAKGQLTAATTRIDSLQGIIENFVKDDNGMVTVTQTGSGMQIDMTQATNRINQLLTAIESAVTEGEANRLRSELLAAIQAVQSRTAYINATQDAQGRPVITLGATDSPFKVEITNEAINFIQNGQVIAYANGQKFYNLRTVVQQDVQIGIGPGFIWKTRDSGNMGLTWVPAQS